MDIGSSFLPSDSLAAFLYAQLEMRENIQAKRERIWKNYAANLYGWAEENGVGLPFVPNYCEQTYHMFYLMFPTLDMRQRMIEHLKSKKIHSVFHYLPLHISDMGKKSGGRKGDCPVTEDISDRLLRLPFYNDLNEDDQARVIEEIHSFPI